MSRGVVKIRNVGPKSAAWLRQVGVRTHEDLVRIGPVEAFLKIKRAGFRPSLNLLYSMAGALDDCHWTDLSEERRSALILELEALLKGKSLLDAKFALERLGLKLGRIERIPSSQPQDMIFDQQFEEGTLLKQGDFVGVSISAGTGGGTIIVPDLIGKSLTEAKKILADSSLIIGKINYQPSATLLPNTILDQYPSSGNSVNPGNAVDLFVTKPADTNIPNEEND